MSTDLERAVRTDRVSAAFADGTVFEAPEAQLLEYLQTLSTGFVPNEGVRHREIIRGLTINHIQMRRLIDRLDRQNQRTTFWFIVLAVGSLVLGAVQIALQLAGK